MRLFTITVAFCRSSQLAWSLMQYRKSRTVWPARQIVVQGHYPIDRERNNEEIKLLCEAFGDIEFWDPGSDLGSAQSQQWALNQLDTKDDDVWINLDPDSACPEYGWDKAMTIVLNNDPDCQVISCMSPMVQGFLTDRGDALIEKEIDGTRYGIPTRPTPFNLSMFRCSFVKEMGGLRQMGPSWGELEGIIWHETQIRQKYHAYLLGFVEDERGKFFHPKTNAEWKDRHMRTIGEHQFLGNYSEFLAYYYQHLADLRL